MAGPSSQSARQLYLAAMSKQAATQGQLDMLARLKQLGLVSAAAGATYGIGRGLYGMTKQPQSLGSGSNVPTQLPVVDPEAFIASEDGEDAMPPQRRKLAEGGLSNTIAGMLPEPDNINTMTGNGIPLTLAAATLPAAAAYRGIRGLFDSHRKAKQEAALQSAKKEYEDSLAQQYRNVVMRKSAEAVELADSIDALFEKRADLNDIMSMIPGANPVNLYGSLASDATGGALGNGPTEGFNSLKGLATAAILAAGAGSAKYMYDRSAKVSPEKVMQEAISRRSRQRRGVPNVLTPQLMDELK